MNSRAAVELAIQEAEGLISQLNQSAMALEQAIATETEIRRLAKEAEALLEMAEAEVVYEAELAAQEKQGPLANIAKTSAAYKAALTHLLAQERRNGGLLSEAAVQVSRLQVQMDRAGIEREQATTRFSACRHAADLKAAILRAMTL